MSKPGIVIGQLLLEPGPVRFGGTVEEFHQLEREGFASLGGRAVAAQPLQILVNADKRKRPGARRSKVGNHRQGLSEKLAGHDLEAAITGASDSEAQRPKCARMR